MKNIMLLTLAGLLGSIAMAGEATAQTDDVVVDGRIITGENLTSSAMPTDRKGGHAQQAIGDVVVRKAGDREAKDFSWGESQGAKMQDFHRTNGAITDGTITDGTMPTDQRTAGALLPAVKPNGLDSLNGLGSTNNLFANSKGGDQGNGLLLPAVRGAGGTQQANGAGGGAGKVQMQDFHFSPNTGADSPASAHGAGGGAGKTLDSKAINFTNNANAAGGGPHVSPGTAKGLNFTNTAKK